MALRITLTRATIKDLLAAALSASQASDQPAVRRYLALVRYATLQSVAATAAEVAVSPDSLYTWLRTLATAGLAALRSASRGGRRPQLTAAQKQRLRELLLAGHEAAGFSTGGWHRPLVQALIEREFGVRFAVGYLPAQQRGLGFSYQKARFVSDHLDEATRTHGLTIQWPPIVAAAQARGALLLFGDEAGFA